MFKNIASFLLREGRLWKRENILITSQIYTQLCSVEELSLSLSHIIPGGRQAEVIIPILQMGKLMPRDIDLLKVTKPMKRSLRNNIQI